VHHGFWKYMDPTHPKYEPGNLWEDVIFDYYKYVDEQIGMLLADLPSDTIVLVVSDHGAKGMHGGICINEWLIRQGYLVLHHYPSKPTKFQDLAVDWSRTRAWSEGGYYARVFLNVRGREPQGIIAREEYESFRDKLAAEIAAIPDEKGQPLNSTVLKPEDLYQEVNGVPPDLIAYFGGLHWRSVGTVGLGTVQTFENDTGPDDANHAEEGVFVLAGPNIPPGRWHQGQLMDIAPTLLELFGVEIPPDMQGRSLPIAALPQQANYAI